MFEDAKWSIRIRKSYVTYPNTRTKTKPLSTYHYTETANTTQCSASTKYYTHKQLTSLLGRLLRSSAQILRHISINDVSPGRSWSMGTIQQQRNRCRMNELLYKIPAPKPNNDLQNATPRKKTKQWSTKHYTEREKTKQWSTKHYTREKKPKQWSTKRYTEREKNKA
jgi:hypothetical protein